MIRKNSNMIFKNQTSLYLVDNGCSKSQPYQQKVHEFLDVWTVVDIRNDKDDTIMLQGKKYQQSIVNTNKRPRFWLVKTGHVGMFTCVKGKVQHIGNSDRADTAPLKGRYNIGNCQEH